MKTKRFSSENVAVATNVVSMVNDINYHLEVTEGTLVNLDYSSVKKFIVESGISFTELFDTIYNGLGLALKVANQIWEDVKLVLKTKFSKSEEKVMDMELLHLEITNQMVRIQRGYEMSCEMNSEFCPPADYSVILETIKKSGIAFEDFKAYLEKEANDEIAKSDNEFLHYSDTRVGYVLFELVRL